MYTHVVLLQESLGVVITVDVDLRNCIVDGRILAPLLNFGFEPRQNQLQPIPLLNFLNEFGNWEIARN